MKKDRRGSGRECGEATRAHKRPRTWHANNSMASSTTLRGVGGAGRYDDRLGPQRCRKGPQARPTTASREILRTQTENLYNTRLEIAGSVSGSLPPKGKTFLAEQTGGAEQEPSAQTHRRSRFTTSAIVTTDTESNGPEYRTNTCGSPSSSRGGPCAFNARAPDLLGRS